MSPRSDSSVAERSLDIRRFEEECRRNRTDETLRLREIRIRHQEARLKTSSKWQDLVSPLGVAAVAGLVGIVGSLISAGQNRDIEREKNQAARILEEGKQQSALILKLAEVSEDKQRASNLLFFAQVGFLKLEPSYQVYLRKIAGLKSGEAVPTPALTSPDLMQPHLAKATGEPSVALLTDFFGLPIEQNAFTQKCQTPTSVLLRRLVVTQSVGPYELTAIRPLVDAVENTFRKIRTEKPDLYSRIGSAGGLCVRLARGSASKIGSFSWGTAFMVTIDGNVPAFGAEPSAELLEIARYFEPSGIKLSQSQYFTATEDLLKQWKSEGKLR
jgi:hypothetical protein